MQELNKIVWTALPNGRVGGQVKLSVHASLQLTGGPRDTLSMSPYAAFVDWPKTLRELQGASWSVSYDGTRVPSVPLSTTSLNSDMWKALFQPSLPVRSRTGVEEFNDCDVSSFRAADLNDSHINHRSVLSALEFLRRQPSISVPDQWRANATAVIERQRSQLNLYVYPGEGGPVGLFSQALTDRYQSMIRAQREAVAFVARLAPTNAVFRARLERDLLRLQKSPDMKIRPDVLLALVDILADQLPRNEAEVIRNAWKTEVNSNAKSYRAAGITEDTVTTAKNATRFALFHLRPDMEQVKTMQADHPCVYDIHSVLSMVNQHPVLLRPLGLTFDLLVAPPPDGTGTVSVALVAQGALPFDPVSLRTAYESAANKFIAAPGRDSILKERMLNVASNVASKNEFSLSLEDIDSANMKDMLFAEASQRSKEFQTRDSQIGTDDWPATHSAGISLLFNKREDKLRVAIATDSMTRQLTATVNGRATPPILYAEHLLLGYRVDVWDDYSNKWHSLHERSGRYNFVDSTTSSLKPWVPPEALRPLEEGFTQFAITVPADAQSGRMKQLQAHDTLFRWTGWSLSVPSPGESLETQEEPSMEGKPFRLIPTFQVKEGTLPPLRFGVGYKVRCRAVDLAGNSLPPEPADAYQPTIGDPKDPRGTPLTYRRWEPVRSPVVLLAERLDPEESPGEQMDHVVIRDGNDGKRRFIVPPRLHQRLAETHSKFDASGLPPGAFPYAELKPDGSFPSFSDDKDAALADRNSYFSYIGTNSDTPDCPYYPDPLAEQAKVRGWRINNLGVRRHVLPDIDVTMPFFDRGERWPNAWTLRIRLQSANGEVWNAAQTPATPNFFEGPVAQPGTEHGLVQDIPLRRGETIEFEISTVLPLRLERGPDQFVDTNNCLALVGGTLSLLEAILVRVTEAHKRLFMDGTHSRVSPSHKMTLVHAVKRPVLKPEFANAFAINRKQIDKKEATVNGNITIDWYSTARLVCEGKWTDVIDDVNKPGPEDVQTTEQAFEIKAGDIKVESSSVTNVDTHLRDLPLEHKLRDTRFHKIEYTLTATSRFREYYSDSEPEDDDEFQVRSTRSYTSLVKNSRRPSIPSVAYVIPAFNWDESKKDNTRTHVRTGALRVYLNRPWFSSGNDERLGVVYASLVANDPQTLPYVTQWGSDPIWKSQPLATLSPVRGDFKNVTDEGANCFLAEFDQNPTPTRLADVVGFKVEYDETRQLWFSDIQIDPQKAYYPFIRLALVRFQPNSIQPDPALAFDRRRSETFAEARISQVVISDFVQLTPTRWASVQKLPGKTYKITICGVSYEKSTENRPGPSLIRLSLQEKWEEVDKSLGWITQEVIQPKDITVSTANGMTTWTYTISNKSVDRLLIEEFEEIYGDGDGTNRDLDKMHTVKKLVYADVFDL